MEEKKGKKIIYTCENENELIADTKKVIKISEGIEFYLYLLIRNFI